MRTPRRHYYEGYKGTGETRRGGRGEGLSSREMNTGEEFSGGKEISGYRDKLSSDAVHSIWDAVSPGRNGRPERSYST